MLDHGDIVYKEVEGPFKYIYVKTRTDLGYYQVWIIGDFSVVHKSDKWARSHMEERNYNPNRDQSTVGADHPGLPASVDRCPNPSIETLNSHRFVTGLCCNCEPLYF